MINILISSARVSPYHKTKIVEIKYIADASKLILETLNPRFLITHTPAVVQAVKIINRTELPFIISNKLCVCKSAMCLGA